MLRCPKCKTEIQPGTDRCPTCGVKFAIKPKVVKEEKPTTSVNQPTESDDVKEDSGYTQKPLPSKEPVENYDTQEQDPDPIPAKTEAPKSVRQKVVKEKPVKEKPVRERPVREQAPKEKPVREKPVKEKQQTETKEERLARMAAARQAAKEAKEKPVREQHVRERSVPADDEPKSGGGAAGVVFGLIALVAVGVLAYLFIKNVQLKYFYLMGIPLIISIIGMIASKKKGFIVVSFLLVIAVALGSMAYVLYS